MINILYFKIRSPTNHIASFTGFLQGLWPRSRQEALGTRLGDNNISALRADTKTYSTFALWRVQ